MIHHLKKTGKFTVLLVGVAILVHCQNKVESKKKPARKVTIAEVEEGIRANIDQKTKDGNGFFDFQNDTIDLRLKLVRVHTEYLSVLGSNEFFACVDLATESGDVYDMDFFLKGKPGDMKVTRTTLHKLNGKPYYNWEQNKEDNTWFTVPNKNASNRLLGVIEKQDAFDFKYEVVLPSIVAPANLWLPVASSDNYQKIELKSLWAPGEQRIIKDPDYGNQILYLQLLPEHSGKHITIDYAVERVEKSPYVSDSELARFLASSKYTPTGGRFKKIADSVTTAREATTALMKARALYDYIIDNMRYAKQGVYGTGDANYACDAKSGNCTEFHSFFISLARSAEVPARFAVGAAIPSERNDGGVNGYHCWAEFYAEGKWWPVDISEANKYTPLATYYFGHHPANRLELSKGRELLPEIAPSSGPINFFAYPILEVGGEKVEVKTNFSFVRKIEKSSA